MTRQSPENCSDILWDNVQGIIAVHNIDGTQLPADNKSDLWLHVDGVIKRLNSEIEGGANPTEAAIKIIEEFPWMSELAGATESGSCFAIAEKHALGQILYVAMAYIRDRQDPKRP
jgi:hypothetical protein